MPKITVALSRTVSDGNYGSFKATIGLEDELPTGTEQDSFASGLRAWCRAFLNETLGDMRKEYLQTEAIARPAAEAFAEEVGGEVRVSPTADILAGRIENPTEEKPPLPTAPQEEVRTPIDDSGNELKAFKVQSFEVDITSGGDKFLKVFGGPWKRPWVPAWREAAELLFDDLESMDLGVIGPPYPIHALTKMGEYKGRPSPDSVVEWKRVA